MNTISNECLYKCGLSIQGNSLNVVGVKSKITKMILKILQWTSELGLFMMRFFPLSIISFFRNYSAPVVWDLSPCLFLRIKEYWSL
jgi:hypothetical protein